MKQAGQIVLFRFPQTDLEQGRLRPALLLARLPGGFDDWLICMVSSQLRHAIANFDEVLTAKDLDFIGSGLKVASVIRISRLAVVEGGALLGAIGGIAPERLQRIRAHLTQWLAQT